MEYRVLETVNQLQQVVELEIAVWGLDPRDAVPMNIMRPITMHGGVVIGCYDDARLVGMSLAFPTKHHSKWVLWSHMAAVDPAYQGQGIGFGLKQAQRKWALDHGYREMRWTFDPLQRGNANFNLRHLGATTSIYHTDYYGIMTDAINHSLPSDRVEASWNLTSRRVAALAERKQISPTLRKISQGEFVLKSNGGMPVTTPINTDSTWLLAEIPNRRDALPPDVALAWRMSLRETLQAAFTQGYTAVDFVECDGISAYVLRAGTPWYLYVLRCADDTLYTGITPTPAKRFAAHQHGRGAAYTAARRPLTLVAAWRFPDRSHALKAEAAFKRLSRPAKQQHIEQRLPYRNAPYIEVTALLD